MKVIYTFSGFFIFIPTAKCSSSLLTVDLLQKHVMTLLRATRLEIPRIIHHHWGGCPELGGLSNYYKLGMFRICPIISIIETTNWWNWDQEDTSWYSTAWPSLVPSLIMDIIWISPTEFSSLISPLIIQLPCHMSHWSHSFQRQASCENVVKF